MELDKFIEAILFYKSEPLSVLKLSGMLGKSKEEILEALDKLENNLVNRGLVLMRDGENIALGTHPKASGFIEGLIKEELSKDLGKAGLETLTIVLYRGPITRAEIDYIRGVNSSFILRSLSVRGLVEKLNNPRDQRSYLYKPTLDTLAFLGVKRLDELPEYKEIRKEIEEFEETVKEQKNGDSR